MRSTLPNSSKRSTKYILKKRKIEGGSTNRNAGGTVSQGLYFGEWQTLSEHKDEISADDAFIIEAERVSKRKMLEQLAVFHKGKRLRTFPVTGGR